MRAYMYSYIAVTVIFTLVLSRLAYVGFASNNNILMGIALLVGILLWVGALRAGKDNSRDLIISSSIPALLSLSIIYRLFQRARFISENGGMERADGYGSPLAFLINLVIESALLAPLICLFIVGLYFYIRRANFRA